MRKETKIISVLAAVFALGASGAVAAADTVNFTVMARDGG